MSKYPLFLGVDVGTTNVRSFIFNQAGEVIGQSFRGVNIYSPTPEMAEEEPEELWRATLETMSEVVEKSRVQADDITMISFSAQMHGMSMIDRDGKVLVRLLTWLDLRAAPQCERLSRVIDPYEIYSRTGCPPLFIYPMAKVLWVRDNLPERFRKCHKILSAKDYIMYRLLGEAHLDHSVASGSQLLNIHKLEWDERVLEIAGIDGDKLPTLHDETEIVGELSGELASKTGLKKGTPIVLGASDGALSNVGLGAVERGIAAINVGSSGALRVLSEKPIVDRDRRARFFCYYTAQRNWLPGGAINNAGIILRWFRNEFGQPEVEEAKRRGVDPYDVITEKAAKVKPGADGLLMIPFFAGERFPVRDPRARGILFGLTLSHGKPHIIRAIMESVIFTLKWIMNILEEQGINIREVRVGGGGARSNVWRQIQADILGKPVVHTKVEEASALGAAMIAAISSGVYKDLREAARSMVKIAERHEPNVENHGKYMRIFRLYRELYTASRRFYEEISKI